ncbi:MAG: VOC family protein [Treponema sp.]|jgi:catechol 2,3-dioxygenase-like lactoylglutathione lyase family enzyme|nr:VOC family protein [Treponema sp.]
MSLVTRIGHVAFYVKDLEKSVDYYCRKLGMRKAFDFRNDDGSIWIQYIEASHEQFIELFPVKETKQCPGQSFFHISLQVDDLDVTLKTLKERGVLCYNGPEGALAKTEPLDKAFVACCNSKCAWTQDPDDNFIEFMELTEKSVHRHFKDND